MQHENTQRKIRVIAFAGGGSGGHSYPLLAVAAEIKRREPAARMYFVSTTTSVESRILAKSGMPFHLIPSGKINGQSFITILKTLFKLPLAFLVSAWIILRDRPQLVMSAGGYAGAPFLVTAALLGIPCAVYEQNRKPGMANRWMARFSQLVFVNFSGTAEYFPGKKVEVVGLPFRREILDARWAPGEWAPALRKNPFRIFVFGGSQGAVAINRLVVAAVGELGDIRDQLFVHHQTGQNDQDIVEKGYRDLGFQNCLVEPYVYDMKNAYREAHMVVCRAGASSIVELAAAQKASLLMPLQSRDNHQEPNAQELVRKNAAMLLLQGEATGAKVAAILRDFFEHREKLQELGKNIGACYSEESEAKIISGIFALL